MIIQKEVVLSITDQVGNLKDLGQCSRFFVWIKRVPAPQVVGLGLAISEVVLAEDRTRRSRFHCHMNHTILLMMSGMTENGMINRLHFRLKVLMRRFGLVTAFKYRNLVKLVHRLVCGEVRAWLKSVGCRIT